MRAVGLLFVASLLHAQSPQFAAALAAGSYYPLDVGNRWVYRIDNRFVTSTYQTWRIDRTEDRNGKTWAVFAIEGTGTLLGLFRADDQGRIYLYTGDGEKLFLDPGRALDSGSVLQITGRQSSSLTPVGTFPDGLLYQNSSNALMYESGTLIRGIGLVASQSIVLAGSSGGLFERRTLVEASLAGGLQIGSNPPSLQLGIENFTLYVSGKQVTNCAVPCYFAACGFTPGADPPDTYKPCARARIQLDHWPANASISVRLQLIASDGSTVFDRTVQPDSAIEQTVTFVQLPLYSTPNQPLPAGIYRLVASTGDKTAEAAITLRIQ